MVGVLTRPIRPWTVARNVHTFVTTEGDGPLGERTRLLASPTLFGPGGPSD